MTRTAPPPKTRLILASQSTYRLELLQTAGYEVEVLPTGVAEPDLTSFANFECGLMYVAQLKARSCLAAGASGLIFAADTVGVSGGQVFGKPTDMADARRMLTAISGTVHHVDTGWCLLRTADQLSIVGVERTTITMRPWTAGELDSYLTRGEWVGKCGAYGLQWPNDPFVTHIAGSAANVIGVPLERLARVICEFPAMTLPIHSVNPPA